MPHRRSFVHLPGGLFWLFWGAKKGGLFLGGPQKRAPSQRPRVRGRNSNRFAIPALRFLRPLAASLCPPTFLASTPKKGRIANPKSPIQNWQFDSEVFFSATAKIR